MTNKAFQRKPDWLKVKIPAGRKQLEIRSLLESLSLNTVCCEAACPNLGECFGRGTAVFMILGRICTRNCTFCCVEKGSPQPLDTNEPANVATAVNKLKLKYVVVTSVTRDDLPDGGAEHFALTVEEIRKQNPGVLIEVLVPDFQGDETALLKVVEAGPDVINHNLETIRQLYPGVRPMATYKRSLELLAKVKGINTGIYTKSGIMVGLGETEGQVLQLLEDLRKVNCDMLTIGQYLAPSKSHHPVVEYIHPDIFARYKTAADSMGFLHVESGPLVRSSYMAERVTELIEQSPTY